MSDPVTTRPQSQPGELAPASDRSRAWLRACLRYGPAAAIVLAICAATIWLAAFAAGAGAAAPLLHGACEPLQVRDRFGRILRTLPAACGHRSRGAWVELDAVPELLQRAVIASEDRRFERHLGVDPLAVARALLENLSAGRVVSGASTLSMQLARMLHAPHRSRSATGKLEQAWLAFALERRLDKAQLLEAYFNHAYYGRGAYGVAEAAALYFGKSPRALSDGEATLLAVLPRAPSSYELGAQLERALSRRARVLAMLEQAGWLAPERRAAILAEPISVRPKAPQPFHAPHFVDWVLAALPEAARRKGGVLDTTLDLELQHALERITAEHVQRMAPAGIAQAGVVVLDTASGEVLAMVGSSGYDAAQLNIVTRRRHLGSLLKPFAYALAIEAGASPASLALDVGDVPSDFRARDWVGREAGPLSYREAVSGSYNLAAVHVLEQVSVQALHARLRLAGVAELGLPPERYGLQLALGSARVRLLDVAAGFGFLVRDGFVRAPRGVLQLARRGAPAFRPPDAGEARVFSPAVSWLVMDMLADDAARHRRFGRDLPVEGPGHVAAKTGTASGMSDVASVLASRERIVASWAGRFDGAPSRGSSGMWGAAPLARRALEVALRGREPSVPPRPSGLVTADVCALSGEPAGPSCPHAQTFALAASAGTARCTWHDAAAQPAPPPELEPWAARARARPVGLAHQAR